MNCLLRGARIVGARNISSGDIRLEGGRIAATGALTRRRGEKTIDARGLYALPGLIDMHTHGGADFNAVMGRYDAATGAFDASPAAFRRSLPRLMQHFARAGTTRVILATGGAPLATLKRACGRLADYLEGPRNGRDGARLEGIFIEGTFIKNPALAGSQNPDTFLRPSVRTFEAMQRAARGHIRYVNVTPEHGRAAERLIRHLAARQVLVGMGHTSCGADQVRRCAGLGLRVALHFLNGPTGSSFKPFHGGNVVEAVLSHRDLYVELICDGWHVNPRYILDVAARKGLDRIVAVTDATFVSRKTRAKKFELGGITGRVHPSGEYLQVSGTADTLFGSTLTLDRAFGNLLSWLTGDLPGVWTGARRPMALERALVQVAQTCATTPARLLRLDGPRGAGRLRRGACADVILAALKGTPGRYRFEVKQTFVGGRAIFPASPQSASP